jgi:dihydroxyacetone kinase
LLNDPSTVLTDDLINAVDQIIPVVENTMDGTSGAVYAIFLNALVYGLRKQDSPSSPKHVTVQTWACALQHALKALAKYTPAKPGDRTLVDALEPFVSKLAESGDIQAAAKAAEAGMEATKSMKASLGRAVYVGGEGEWMGKVPDPGAYGLSEFLAGLAEGVLG